MVGTSMITIIPMAKAVRLPATIGRPMPGGRYNGRRRTGTMPPRSARGARALKGPGRPLVPEEERAEILAALTCIDYVTIFDEPTASELLTLLQPVIYVKGGDYGLEQSSTPDINRLPEAKVVQQYGGVVRLIAYLPHHSTSELIAAVRQLPLSNRYNKGGLEGDHKGAPLQ